MAALSADYPNLQTEPRAGRDAFLMDPADVLYRGGLVGVEPADGLLKPWADDATMIFQGILLEKEPATGNTGLEMGGTSAYGRVNNHGDTLRKIAVAGSTPLVGDKVYCATDNIADITKAATANAKAIGYITKKWSASSYDVRLFTPEEYIGLM